MQPAHTRRLPAELARRLKAWKRREKARVKQDAAVHAAIDEEARETERRRALTDAQIMAENEALGKHTRRERQQGQRKFLQKYYHKGAFYMDDDSLQRKPGTGIGGSGAVAGGGDVRQRNYDEATGEDKFDFAALPKVLQVKKFGRAGRSKYTHLKDQDTTRADSMHAMGAKVLTKRRK